jgi:alcohol dehydrogenase
MRKTIALVEKNGGTINDYVLDGKCAETEVAGKYPCVCIATTAGTGSEVTNFSVVIVPETHEKPGFGFSCLAPEVSIVDPELMATMPKGVTASTGIDVFFHAMEAYLSRAATPFSDMCALTAMDIVAKNLGRVLEDGRDMEARSRMAWASTLGGFSIFQTGGGIGIPL